MRVKGIRVQAVAHHRNGIEGAPFSVVVFDELAGTQHDEQGRKVGIVFDKPGHCAVLDVAKLAAGDIAFASNSWRGDEYEPHLREAIAKAA